MEVKVKLISEKDKEIIQAVKFQLEHLFLQLKGVGKLYFVPIIVLYILLPFILWADYSASGNSIDRIFVAQCNFFMPILSVWWVFLVMKEYVEGEGKEVLYLNEHSKFKEVIILYVYYVIHLLFFFGVALFFIPNVVFALFLQIILASFFYCGLGYLFLYLTQNISIAFLPLICYSIYCSNSGVLSVAFLNRSIYWEYPIKYTIEMIVAGCICFGVGIHLNKRKFLR